MADELEITLEVPTADNGESVTEQARDSVETIVELAKEIADEKTIDAGALAEIHSRIDRTVEMCNAIDDRTKRIEDLLFEIRDNVTSLLVMEVTAPEVEPTVEVEIKLDEEQPAAPAQPADQTPPEERKPARARKWI